MINCEREGTTFENPTTCIARQKLIAEAEERKEQGERLLSGQSKHFTRYKNSCGGCRTGLKLYRESLEEG